jgi:hypothetical protein
MQAAAHERIVHFSYRSNQQMPLSADLSYGNVSQPSTEFIQSGFAKKTNVFSRKMFFNDLINTKLDSLYPVIWHFVLNL